MTKLELLNEYHAQECNNLYISSDNYAMTRPRRGREKDYDKYAERVALLEAIISDMEQGQIGSVNQTERRVAVPKTVTVDYGA